jgi:hypothetical protein
MLTQSLLNPTKLLIESSAWRCQKKNLLIFKKNQQTSSITSTILIKTTAWNRYYHASSSTGNSTNSNTIQDSRHRIVMIGEKEYDHLKQIRLIVEPTPACTNPTTIASICVKRNIIFGSRIYSTSPQDLMMGTKRGGVGVTGTGTGGGGGGDYVQITLPLLEKALLEASREGDQPQGLAALNGLSQYVRHAIQQEGFSPALEVWRSRCGLPCGDDGGDGDAGLNGDPIMNDHAQQVLEAVTAVATQIPRRGHSIVGIGTYCDARKGWTDLAKEYATVSAATRDVDRYRHVQQGDASLFQSMGGFLVNIEYIGYDENPEYWKDAGGAMARFFFM